MFYNFFHFRGERGIRTPEPLWTVTRFPGVPLQPLEHLSLRLANVLFASNPPLLYDVFYSQHSFQQQKYIKFLV